jgi:hypothetical protein
MGAVLVRRVYWSGGYEEGVQDSLLYILYQSCLHFVLEV